MEKKEIKKNLIRNLAYYKDSNDIRKYQMEAK